MRKFKKCFLVSVLLCTLSFVIGGCGDDGNNAKDSSSEVSTEVATLEEEQTTEATTEATTESTTQATTEAAVEENVSVDLFADTGLDTFELSSEDLHDGAWDPVISSVDDGQNVSPQLSWEPVPEATAYVIYMVDSSAGYWLHWKAKNVTETNFSQGWASEEEYIGPYPPGGTHCYDIYVFALKQPVERVKGTFNTQNAIFYNNAMDLDEVEEGTSGNIIAYGYLPGTYTRAN